MSLYNMVFGTNPATFFILPMLGKHPSEYPRFRDCFLRDEKYPEYNDYIHIYTRTGGGNRKEYRIENEAIRQHENFVIDFDDKFDKTYASWIFSVPEKWKSDFDKIISNDLENVSIEYQSKIKEIFPKLKNKIDGIWNK